MLPQSYVVDFVHFSWEALFSLSSGWGEDKGGEGGGLGRRGKSGSGIGM